MLHLADLGCGDGRVLLAAAGAHGVSGWGVELDEELVRVARQAARKVGASGRLSATIGVWPLLQTIMQC